MKPFNLEAFKNGEVAITRDGEEAHFLAYDVALAPFTLVFRVGGQLAVANDEGKTYVLRSMDLVGMKPATKKLWVAVSEAKKKGRPGRYSTHAYVDKEDAVREFHKCFPSGYPVGYSLHEVEVEE